jgi:hypothetical protein
MIGPEIDNAPGEASRLTLLMRQANNRIYMLGLQIGHGEESLLQLHCECGDPQCGSVVMRSTDGFPLQSPPGSIVAHPADARFLRA